MNYISSNLKHLRKIKALSQCDLAHFVGLNRGNIASYESGVAEPKMEFTLRLANFFSVDLNEFITKDLSENPRETVALNESPIPLVPTKSDSPVLLDSEMQRIRTEFVEFQNIIKGMSCYHQFQMNQISAPSDAVKVLDQEFERLFSVVNSIMKSHEYLIQVIENHDNCDCH